MSGIFRGRSRCRSAQLQRELPVLWHSAILLLAAGRRDHAFQLAGRFGKTDLLTELDGVEKDIVSMIIARRKQFIHRTFHGASVSDGVLYHGRCRLMGHAVGMPSVLDGALENNLCQTVSSVALTDLPCDCRLEVLSQNRHRSHNERNDACNEFHQ